MPALSFLSFSTSYVGSGAHRIPYGRNPYGLGSTKFEFQFYVLRNYYIHERSEKDGKAVPVVAFSFLVSHFKAVPQCTTEIIELLTDR